MRRIISFAALVLILIGVGSTLVQAHATLENSQAQSGASYRGVVRIGHGCKNSATTSLKIKIPEGLVNVKPMPKSGWILTTVKSAYVQTHTVHGHDESEGVSEIIWSGSKLPDDNYDEFVFSSLVSSKVEPESILYFPVIQTCEQSENAWVDIPGTQGQKLVFPAPALKITALKTSVLKTSADKDASITTETLTISQAWSRETPPATKVAAGYMSITNKGSVSDRLIGAENSAAETTELHNMSNANGIMTMDRIANGLEIKSGEILKLAPGGNHIMFTGLKAPQKAGTDFPAYLIFEKAGRVKVMFSVRPLKDTQDHPHMDHAH